MTTEQHVIAEITGVFRLVESLQARVAELEQDRKRLRGALEQAVGAFEEIECGSDQCRCGYSGCDRYCSSRARVYHYKFAAVLTQKEHA